MFQQHSDNQTHKYDNSWQMFLSVSHYTSWKSQNAWFMLCFYLHGLWCMICK